MKRFMRIGKAFALVSAFGLCFPQAGMVLHAAEPAPAAVQAQKAPSKLSLDVVTNAAGELRGAAVNPDSAPSAKAKVTLRSLSGKETAQTSTDEAGRFLFQGVRPGAYGLTVTGDKGRAEKFVRVWFQENAPPAATPVALVPLESQQPNDVVRGIPLGEEPFPNLGYVGAGLILFGGAAAGVGLAAALGAFDGNGGGALPPPATPGTAASP